MARLPIPGGDKNTWGDVLNSFLSQAHNSDGTLKQDAIRAAMSDADASNKGIVQLGGDLAGSAATPTVPGLATKQPLSGDLTAIAGLSSVDNDIIQRKSGVWTNRTPAQVKTDLALTGTDVAFTTGGAIPATDIQAAIRAVSAGAERTIDPAVRRFRAEAARARSGGFMTMTVWLGDSLTEAFSPTKRGFMWPLYLSRRLNGPRPMRAEYIPSSTSAYPAIDAPSWPGGQAPWNYGNAVGTVDYGLDVHAAHISAGGFIELPYFGDVVNIIYARTPAAPAGGCPVLIDGVQVATLSANGAALASQAGAYGTIGDYGAHTLRINVPSGTLTVEGAVVHDGTAWGFGLAFGTIGVTVAGHAGFTAAQFAGNDFPNWPAGVAARTPSLVGIALGVNDSGQNPPRTAQQYREDMIAIMNKIDAAVDSAGGTRPGYLLVEMIGLPAAYVPAAWEACDAVDSDRCAVLDLQTRLNGTGWGTLLSGALVADGHPGNAGQVWLADAIASAIDTAEMRPPTTPLEGVILEAITPTTARLAWAELLTAVPDPASPTTYDASPTGAVVGERRHRVWLDPGVYQARATLSRGNDRGQCQVLVGHTSLGTADCYQVSADVNVFTLGSNITIDTPGWYPVTIRKLATKNASSSEYAVRFHRLHLRRL